MFGRENVLEGKCECKGRCGSSEDNDGTVVDFHQTKACYLKCIKNIIQLNFQTLLT